MRYRKLDAAGDMIFGRAPADIWHNVPDAVGQSIKTRLLLFRGEWFLDNTEGTPWGGFPLTDQVVLRGQILGTNTQAVRDLAIKVRVLETNGVIGISNYSSAVDPSTRQFTVSMTVDTVYGSLQLSLPTGPFI